jgi:hypothetical protein
MRKALRYATLRLVTWAATNWRFMDSLIELPLMHWDHEPKGKESREAS